MVYLRIHCATCGGVWEVYHRDNWNNDKARQCPHCFAEISRQTWEKYVLSVFGEARDANAELYKDYTGYYDKPLFSFDVMANHIYPNGKSNDRS